MSSPTTPPAPPRVLVVEDERAIQIALKGLLSKEGYDVHLAGSGQAALVEIAEGAFDLVLTDLALGNGPDGLAVLAASKASRPETPVVLLTAHGNERVAVEAMKAGADDYLPKPFDNDELRVVCRRVLDRTRLVREHRLLLDRVEREYGFGALVGSGPAMQRVFDVIRKVAETDLGVLVRGESGTGKELVAQALHQRSARAQRPFVAVNCAAISRELVESELFGHEKGAFTGADSRRIGKFEAANGGTLFLDEIGDMPAETQAKVLRVLQERTFERVGGNTTMKVDVRVVAATHRDLEAEVAKGAFRQDLYYRLKVVQIELPPLRERAEDVPALAQRFLSKLAERLGRPAPVLSEAALTRLARHPFPGNVRELRNVIEQAAVLASGGTVEVADLGVGEGSAVASALASRGAASALDGEAAVAAGTPFAEAKKAAVERFERDYITEALRRHDGNVSRTADAIGMVRQSLQQKIRELGLRDRE
jgi:DNA-binding NtrC family response regulator